MPPPVENWGRNAKTVVLVYKIIAAGPWEKAQSQGVFAGAAIDLADGYIHLSAAEQVEETARLHFRGQRDLVLVAFNAGSLPNLTWEASRGGALFPHHYGSIDPALALWSKPLPWEDASHRFPEGWRG